MTEQNIPKLRVSKEEARKKIEAQIDKGEQLSSRQINTHGELVKATMESDNWSRYNKDLLAILFSPAPEHDYEHSLNFEEEKNLQITYRLIDPLKAEVMEYTKNLAGRISNLKGILGRIELYDAHIDRSKLMHGNAVFVVHGHDEAAKLAIADFVKRFDLNPIILDEKANEGQTIIEKFEAHAGEAGYAIILLTPDDVGAAKDNANDLKPRARQNVILELGYFMGQLGRNRVCVLYRGNVELPSDIHGIAYVPMNNPAEWQLKLAKEMKQTGLPIDLNKLA